MTKLWLSKELEYTQSVWHYQVLKRKFWQEDGYRVLALYLRPSDARCPKCGSHDVASYRHRDRTLIGLPNGKCQVRFVVPVRKVLCRSCRAATYERIPFAAYKNARITRALSKKLLDRAAVTSMKSLAEEHHVSWRTVRDTIEDGLRKRYRKRDLSKVTNIGIDELYVFRNERPSRKYITTVRDQDTGTVLEVARSKGVMAMRRFERKIGPYKDNIKSVSMDMSSSFNLWAETYLPNAYRVIDRFHVTKALTNRVDKARRKVAAPLFDEWIRDAQASEISELRSAAKTFLRNREGFLAYWTTGGKNNAATEGFSRKTRGLLEMSYGFHDYRFLRLS